MKRQQARFLKEMTKNNRDENGRAILNPWRMAFIIHYYGNGARAHTF